MLYHKITLHQYGSSWLDMNSLFGAEEGYHEQNNGEVADIFASKSV